MAFKNPFQPKLFCDSMIHGRAVSCHCPAGRRGENGSNSGQEVRNILVLLELLPGSALAQGWLCSASSQSDKGDSPLLCFLEKDSSGAPVDCTEDGQQ